ncbi:DNA-binding response regulator [Fontibacter flavus]|uniref:DNA-binding response regulator n=1 Tax=Fontibacter flavus TaxID=654838 RepID=A0ABV6FU64_9BACT|nr:DNA-binding response regulator [Cyclobacteriaceae bacterium]
MSQSKILIVEDEIIVTMDLEETLARLGFEVIGAANTPEEARDFFAVQVPDVIVCDINLNADIDGIALMKELMRKGDFKVIFLTAFHDDQTIAKTLEIEGSFYLVKPFNANQLKASLQIVLSKNQGNQTEAPDFLSSRELEIIGLLADGKSSYEIADALNISYHTITTHTKNIRKKLDVHTNLDVVAKALKNKWI